MYERKKKKKRIKEKRRRKNKRKNVKEVCTKPEGRKTKKNSESREKKDG